MNDDALLNVINLNAFSTSYECKYSNEKEKVNRENRSNIIFIHIHLFPSFIEQKSLTNVSYTA